jgi:hypothetical protein
MELRKPFEESISPAYVICGPVQQIVLSYQAARLGIDSWAPLKVYKYGLHSNFNSFLNKKKVLTSEVLT